MLFLNAKLPPLKAAHAEIL